jgi:hypothetical protein
MDMYVICFSNVCTTAERVVCGCLCLLCWARTPTTRTAQSETDERFNFFQSI